MYHFNISQEYLHWASYKFPNFLSSTCFRYKVGLIYMYTLVDRIFKINNTTTGREKDLQQLSINLQRNSFPSHLIDNIIDGYKNKFFFRPTQNNTSTTWENTAGIRYFKLPFVGDFSTVTGKKLKHLLAVYCKDISIRIVFSFFKIKMFFSFKDPIPDALKSMVVYQFTCAGCDIGETSRHLATRVKEHLSIDKNSHVFKHLNGSPTIIDKTVGKVTTFDVFFASLPTPLIQCCAKLNAFRRKL